MSRYGVRLRNLTTKISTILPYGKRGIRRNRQSRYEYEVVFIKSSLILCSNSNTNGLISIEWLCLGK